VFEWREAVVARLVKGDSLYVPRPELEASDLLSIDQTQRMQARLVTFLVAHIETVLGRLTILATPDQANHLQAKDTFSEVESSQNVHKDVTGVNDMPASDQAATSAANVLLDADQLADDGAAAIANQPIAAGSLSGAAKGIAYILFERLGSVPTLDISGI
jgi:hypothetical protein